MMSEAADDQLAFALTDWERLLEVGVDLTASHADCNAINALFGKRIVNLQPTVLLTPSTAASNNLERLGKLRRRLVKMGIDVVTDSRLEAICEQLIRVKTENHPSLAKVNAIQGADKSELLRLKDLEQWAATRLAVHASFPDAKSALERLDKVTAYELRQLSPHTVNSDDATFLKALELGAKIRKGISCAQYHLIDRVIASKIDALQRSRAIYFSSTCTGESAPSQPEKSKNQNNDKMNGNKEQVLTSQSKHMELEATIRTLIHDKKVMAEDKVALTRERDNLTLALKKLEDRLQQPLAHEREAYNRLQSAFLEERNNHQKSQAEVLKAQELLSEAQENRQLLAMDIEKLKAEKSLLTQASGTSSNMAEALEEARGERMRLELDVKCLSARLEYTEGAYRELVWNSDKLTAENENMKTELDQLRGNLSQSAISPSGHQNRPSGPSSTNELLAAENARLGKELGETKGTLGAIMSSLSPHSAAFPITLNVPETASNTEYQMDRVLPQIGEPVRNSVSKNVNGPDPKMQATNSTTNMVGPNAHTLNQTPSSNMKSCVGSTTNWSPDAAILTPSTSAGTNQWSFAIPRRAPSPSGSVDSEL